MWLLKRMNTSPTTIASLRQPTSSRFLQTGRGRAATGIAAAPRVAPDLQFRRGDAALDEAQPQLGRACGRRGQGAGGAAGAVDPVVLSGVGSDHLARGVKHLVGLAHRIVGELDRVLRNFCCRASREGDDGDVAKSVREILGGGNPGSSNMDGGRVQVSADGQSPPQPRLVAGLGQCQALKLCKLAVPTPALGQDPRQDRERDSGCIPGSAMAHCDAAGVNGSNRTLSWRSASADDAEWMSGKSRARLAPGLDKGSLMDGCRTGAR